MSFPQFAAAAAAAAAAAGLPASVPQSSSSVPASSQRLIHLPGHPCPSLPPWLLQTLGACEIYSGLRQSINTRTANRDSHAPWPGQLTVTGSRSPERARRVYVSPTPGDKYVFATPGSGRAAGAARSARGCQDPGIRGEISTPRKMFQVRGANLSGLEGLEGWNRRRRFQRNLVQACNPQAGLVGNL
ncbi:hypothetical protein C0Q70_19121 [Pomacea canaliculata]|uniref:Uncharacterized protein n=1 Tax=Pomacea canaliculata TaxID=400727 RepID=A0A2T7NII1_POMCA|nr:hypothetical protein C0Q70_19121 [Pomacea canaliculata]